MAALKVSAEYGNSLLGETYQHQDWATRIRPEQPANAATDPLCVLSSAGFPLCGKILHRRLPYLRLKHVRPCEVCFTCRNEIYNATRPANARRKD